MSISYCYIGTYNTDSLNLGTWGRPMSSTALRAMHRRELIRYHVKNAAITVTVLVLGFAAIMEVCDLAGFLGPHPWE